MQEIHILEEDYYLSTIYAAGEHLSTRDMPWVPALHFESVDSLGFPLLLSVLTVLSTVLFRAEKTSVWTL
jgi:hypothetical protein